MGYGRRHTSISAEKSHTVCFTSSFPVLPATPYAGLTGSFVSVFQLPPAHHAGTWCLQGSGKNISMLANIVQGSGGILHITTWMTVSACFLSSKLIMRAKRDLCLLLSLCSRLRPGELATGHIGPFGDGSHPTFLPHRLCFHRRRLRFAPSRCLSPTPGTGSFEMYRTFRAPGRCSCSNAATQPGSVYNTASMYLPNQTCN